MYGAQTDVIRWNIQRAGQADAPENRYVTKDNHLGFVDVACGDNRQAILASRRTIPMMVISRPQGLLTRLQNQEEQVFSNGGLAILPPAGLWKGVK